MENWISPRRDLIQDICLVVLDMAIYSASVEDNATVFCHLVNHETGEFARNRTYPVMDSRLSGFAAQSLSVYPKNLSWFAPLNHNARFLVDPRYLMMYSAWLWCSWEGLAQNCDMRITAKAMSGWVPSIIYSKDPITDWYWEHKSKVASVSEIFGL